MTNLLLIWKSLLTNEYRFEHAEKNYRYIVSIVDLVAR